MSVSLIPLWNEYNKMLLRGLRDLRAPGNRLAVEFTTIIHLPTSAFIVTVHLSVAYRIIKDAIFHTGLQRSVLSTQDLNNSIRVLLKKWQNYLIKKHCHATKIIIKKRLRLIIQSLNTKRLDQNFTITKFNKFLILQIYPLIFKNSWLLWSMGKLKK